MEYFYHCNYTNNPTSCKIVGGVHIVLLILSLVKLLEISKETRRRAGGWDALAFFALAIVALNISGFGLLVAILLVVAASAIKRSAASKSSASKLMVWIILNAIGIALLFMIVLNAIGIALLFIEVFGGRGLLVKLLLIADTYV